MTAARPGGLAGRLLAALALVLATAGITAWLVAGAVGPAIFHDHLLLAGTDRPEDAVAHAEEAFRTASGLALTIGLAAAAVAALVVSLVLTRRIGASLSALTVAVQQVAGGDFEARLPTPGMGTEFEQLVSAFNQMAARLDASERLRRRLLSDVAHEVRTPVATMNAYLEALEDGMTELSPEVVALLRGQGTRLTRLAEDLAAVTKAESGELAMAFAPVDPGALLRDAHAAARTHAHTAGIEVTVDLPDALPTVFADADRMAQVLGNLVDNALRHTPSGGQVRLSGRQLEQGVALVVTDTGEGIGAEHLPYIFERFYRADTARDRVRGGSGIGLSITKALVEAHGGTLTARSDGTGKGATFTVTLPARIP